MAKFKESSFKTSTEVYEHYQSMLQNEQQTLTALSSTWRKYAFIRGIAFLVSLLPLVLVLRQTFGLFYPWLGLTAILFIGFLCLAVFHEKMSRQIRLARLQIKMHKESLSRMDRQMQGVFMPHYELPTAVVPVSGDLDLFGEQSLYQLLATPRTPFGIQTLGDWIATGADIEEIQARQIAVAELRHQDEWRHDFRMRCEQLASSQSGPNQFVQWAESPNWVDKHRVLLWFCRFTSAISIIALLMICFGITSWSFSMPLLMLALALNFMLSVIYAGGIHEIFNKISSHQDEISHYENLFNEVVEFKCESPFLKQVQSELTADQNDVRKKIQSLGKWNWLANIRRNGIFFLGYMALEFLFMWDIHILERLENWKNNSGHRGRVWFEALGRWEAILALSKLAHDEPEWQFPTVAVPEKNRALIAGKKVGHPLMDAQRVSNDVEVGPTGTVLLVSGSNMSGKSTLLRSIGLNSVLAQMGSVVCAQQMSLPRVQIETSMRIVDSLATGTSFFMAELKRLKEIVDEARQLSDSNDKTLLFLLDEILQGTNSRERQIAVTRVVKNLIDSGAIGAISTHDLELAAAPELEKACIPVHFMEKFIEVDGKKKMTFDYQMRRGVSETTNALALLELVGLADN